MCNLNEAIEEEAIKKYEKILEEIREGYNAERELYIHNTFKRMLNIGLSKEEALSYTSEIFNLTPQETAHYFNPQ